jgi:S1-C subfamily serine protease
VITAVNNTPVASTSQLAAVLAHLNPGQRIPITVTDQQGQTRTVMVTLGQLPGS